MPSLQAKMFVVFALIATVPLMALSYLALTETRAALAEEVGRAHADTARAAAAYVGEYVESGRLLVDADARDARLVAAARANDTAALNATLEALRTQAQREGQPLFLRMAVLDAEGRVVASAPPGTAPASVAPRAPGSAVVLAPAEGVVPIVAPLREGSDAAAALVGELAIAPLGDRLQAFAFGPSEGVLVTDARGHLLTHPVAAAGLDWSEVEPVRRALAGAPGFVEFDEPVNGTRVLAGYAPVASLGWAVVEQVPATEAYAGLARLTAALIVLSSVLLGVILLASVVLARRIVRPVRELTTAAGAVAAGRLGTRISLKGDDEIAELAATFNTMADRIGESLDGLRRSEARYRNLVESANDLIVTLEPDRTVSFAGPLAERLLGWPPGELSGRPLATLVHAADRARFEEAVHRVLDDAEPVLYLPHMVVTRDGAVRAFRSNLSPIFGPDGRPARVLVVSRDVTAERRQERFREHAFDMARLVSAQTDLDRLAREGLAIALAAADATRGSVHILDAGGMREAAATPGFDPAAPLAVRAVGEQRSVEAGTLLAVPLMERGEALGALIVEREGELEGGEADELAALASQLAVGIRRSLFEGRLREYATELERRVEERTAELQAKNEEIESFLYSVSHDLKAPLISIEGYAQGLEEDYASVLDADGRQYLDRIRKNATLMEKLILDILELSRIGRVRSEVEDVDVAAVVGEVASRLEDRVAAAGGELVVDAGLPRVRGERNRIEQLFGNLVENALKYRHPERRLRVRVRGEAAPEGAHFVVEDNGRGVPPEQREQLFRIFQRLATPAGMPDPGGTGMGLAIVKRIVETHGGQVWMEDAPGGGAAFHVVLPIARSVAA